MFKSVASALIAGFILVACGPAETPAPGAENAIEFPLPAITNPEECAAKGGSIRPVCRQQVPTCVVTYTDVGKTCKDDADCQGKCLLEGDPPADRTQQVEGTCQADSDPCGCRTEIKGGLAQETICVD